MKKQRYRKNMTDEQKQRYRKNTTNKNKTNKQKQKIKDYQKQYREN